MILAQRYIDGKTGERRLKLTNPNEKNNLGNSRNTSFGDELIKDVLAAGKTKEDLYRVVAEDLRCSAEEVKEICEAHL